MQTIPYRSHLEWALIIVALAVFLALFAAAILYMIRPIFWDQGNASNTRGAKLVDNVVRGIVACTVAGLVYIYVILIDTIIRLLGVAIRGTLVTNPIIIGVGCMLLGLAIYILRYNLRFYYGIVESLFGVVVTTNSSHVSDGAALLQVFAGIYVIVRGLDNMERGAAEDKKLKPMRDRIFRVFAK